MTAQRPDFWPPIADRHLASRLAMNEAQFEAIARKLARRVQGRPYVRANYEHAITHLWERPRESFWIRAERSSVTSGRWTRLFRCLDLELEFRSLT